MSILDEILGNDEGVTDYMEEATGRSPAVDGPAESANYRQPSMVPDQSDITGDQDLLHIYSPEQEVPQDLIDKMIEKEQKALNVKKEASKLQKQQERLKKSLFEQMQLEQESLVET